jgi:hypothetical protein
MVHRRRLIVADLYQIQPRLRIIQDWPFQRRGLVLEPCDYRFGNVLYFWGLRRGLFDPVHHVRFKQSAECGHEAC